jgi:hypothetical protein
MKKPMVLLVCAAAWACSDLGFGLRTATDLERAATQWTRGRPDDYVYAVERLCFCPHWGPVRVTVRGDSVVSRVFAGSGDPIPDHLRDAFPSVDGLFEMLTEAYEEEAHEIRATYDARSGVPVDFWIDYSEMTADEEVGMRVTEAVTGFAP